MLYWFIIFLIGLKLLFKFTIGICRSNVSLVGKTALITGGNAGIGYYTTLGLASRGCRVIIASRNNTDEIRNDIIKHTHNPNIVTKYLDLASLESVRKLAADIIATEERLDILINNAGCGGFGEARSEDGILIGMQINHFGPFLLTHLLQDLLKKSAPSRVIFTSSILSFTNNLSNDIKYLDDQIFSKDGSNFWSDIFVYSNSKLGNMVAAKEFGRILKNSGVTVNTVHPGFVQTEIFNKCFQFYFSQFILSLFYAVSSALVMRSAYEGAQTLIKVAISNKFKNITGEHFCECTYSKWFAPRSAQNAEFRKKVWDETRRILKIND